MNARASPWLRHAPWVVLGLGLLVIGAGIGLRNPWPADEPVYSLIARDMLRHGNWLIPMVGGDYFQDKPPLLFWLQAVSYKITGSYSVGFLLPSLLAGLGTLWLTYDLGRRLWNREAGAYAALLLLFCVQFTLQARRAQLDALLVFFTTLSLYCLLRQLLLDGGWRWTVGAGLAAGLGALSKVVGFLSFLVLLPWLFAVWRNWPRVRWQRPWPAWLLGAAACMAVTAAWLLPVWLRAQHDSAVADYFHELVFVQTLGRYVDPWHHYRPAWYYLQVMITLWLPAVLLLPWAIPRWRQALRDRDARVLLPLGFAASYVLFFTISHGKRDLYILCALPMLVLPMGYVLPELLQRRAVQWTLAVFAALIVLLCAGGYVYLAYIDTLRGAKLLQQGGLSTLAPLAVLAVLGMLALAVWRLQRAHLALAALLVAGWQMAGWWVFPAMDGARSAADFIARLEAMAVPQRELGLLAYHEHFLWHLQRPSVNFGNRRFREGDAETFDAAAWLAADPTRQLLVPERMLKPCFDAVADRRLVGNSSRGDWYLVSG
ncbi:MAG TPA: glycosyltransferase family 39 protein, partial [Steroidobacteraceae bacterium]|nr:glycosyltransferase family 39 protein [Steroidobacteraceae bacterium]